MKQLDDTSCAVNKNLWFTWVVVSSCSAFPTFYLMFPLRRNSHENWCFGKLYYELQTNRKKWHSGQYQLKMVPQVKKHYWLDEILMKWEKWSMVILWKSMGIYFIVYICMQCIYVDMSITNEYFKHKFSQKNKILSFDRRHNWDLNNLSDLLVNITIWGRPHIPWFTVQCILFILQYLGCMQVTLSWSYLYAKPLSKD